MIKDLAIITYVILCLGVGSFVLYFLLDKLSRYLKKKIFNEDV